MELNTLHILVHTYCTLQEIYLLNNKYKFLVLCSSIILGHGPPAYGLAD